MKNTYVFGSAIKNGIHYYCNIFLPAAQQQLAHIYEYIMMQAIKYAIQNGNNTITNSTLNKTCKFHLYGINTIEKCTSFEFVFLCGLLQTADVIIETFDNNTYICYVCNAKFQNGAMLVRHKVQDHSRDKTVMRPFSKNGCFAILENEDRLDKHIHETCFANENAVKRIDCPYKEYGYITTVARKSNLKTHLKTVTQQR